MLVEQLAIKSSRSDVDRIERVSVWELAGRTPRTPVILADAAVEWPQHGRISPDYLRRVYGDRSAQLLGQQCSLAELIDRLERATAAQPLAYPCKFEIAKDFRELLAEVTPRFACSLPDRQNSVLVPQRLFDGVNNLEIFFGGAGGRFPYLHYDVMHLHAWITQVHGDKEFTLYSPEQASLLYVDPDRPWRSRVRNHHHPDLDRYPLLRQARAQKVVLHAGETLFIPAGWWHTAHSLNFTISIAFDQLAAVNWAAFVGDIVALQKRAGKQLRAMLLGTYLRIVGGLLTVHEILGGGRERQWGRR